MVFCDVGPPQLAVAISTLQPDTRQNVAEFVIVSAVTNRLTQIRALCCEQASIEYAVRRQSRPTAAAAEGFGHGRYESDLAQAIHVLITTSDFARIVSIQGPQRPALLHHCMKLFGRHDLVSAPAVAIADVHVFYQAHDMTRAAKVIEQIEDGVVVHAPFHDHIDLDR